MVKYKSDVLFTAIIYIVLVFVGIICLFPVLYVFTVSLTPLEEVLKRGGVVILPTRITFAAYKLFLETPGVIDSFKITTVITILGTIINVFLTVLMAYPLSKKDLIGGRFLLFFAILPMLFAPGIIPSYLVVKDTGIINSIWSLILPGAIWSYVLLITRTFFTRFEIPLIESARIEGAGEFRVLFQIIVPLSMPIIATISLFFGIGHWNEYFGGIMYITDNTKRPLQVVLRNILLAQEKLT